jgi:hypothetical protein
MNGVARTRVETKQVFHAGISNHVCHLVSPMLMLLWCDPLGATGRFPNAIFIVERDDA